MFEIFSVVQIFWEKADLRFSEFAFDDVRIHESFEKLHARFGKLNFFCLAYVSEVKNLAIVKEEDSVEEAKR